MQPYYTKHVCSVSILIQGTTEMIIFLSGLAAPLFPGNRRKSGGHGAALVYARGATYGRVVYRAGEIRVSGAKIYIPSAAHWSVKCRFCTGKSLSENLISASTNPQYDDRLFIELQVQYMKIPSSEHGENMLCTEIVFDIQNNFCTQHVLPMLCKNKSFWQRFTCMFIKFWRLSFLKMTTMNRFM